MITKAQRAARKNFVGGSDQPVLWGYGFGGRGPADLWLEKTGQVEASETSDAAELGIILEGPILKMMMDRAKRDGIKAYGMEKNISVRHPSIECMAANLDAVVNWGGEPATVEAKTTGLMGLLEPGAWGEPGTDDVPDATMIQVQHGLACKPGINLAIVPAIVGFRGFAIYLVRRHDKLIRECERRSVEFWKHVETKTPPPAVPTLDTLSRIRRVEGKSVDVDPGLVEQFQRIRDARLRFEKKFEFLENGAKAALVWALGDAEFGDPPGLDHIVKYTQVEVKEHVVADFSYRKLSVVKRPKKK